MEERMWSSEDGALKHATYTRAGATLLSSYKDGDKYGYHVDVDLDCIVTAVLMISLTEEPQFTGGDLVLGDSVEKFENNKLIVFPSCTNHAVTEVSMTSDEFKDRRFTLQHFISSVPHRTVFPDESNTK